MRPLVLLLLLLLLCSFTSSKGGWKKIRVRRRREPRDSHGNATSESSSVDQLDSAALSEKKRRPKKPSHRASPEGLEAMPLWLGAFAHADLLYGCHPAAPYCTRPAAPSPPGPPPSLCVVFTSFNVETYVETAMASLLHQSYRDMVVVAIDDGSTDGSRDSIRAFAAKDSRVQPIFLPVRTLGGTSHVANIGIARCLEWGSTYVAFMDGDDLLRRDAFQLMVKRADATQADLVIANFQTFTRRERPVADPKSPPAVNGGGDKNGNGNGTVVAAAAAAASLSRTRTYRPYDLYHFNTMLNLDPGLRSERGSDEDGMMYERLRYVRASF